VSTLYVETSAVLAWLFGEPGSRLVVARVASANRVVSSVLTLVEAERALIRVESLGTFAAADCQKLRGMLAKASRSWLMMEVSAEVRSRAVRPFPVEPICTLDALHVSTVLRFLKAYPDLAVLSLDRRILDNAAALGIVGVAP